ncbi:hypothetical protein BURPS1710b_0726 [Burkholderia pseudomallei 1710b]|uniref:Uncharacterized protein n=1 Tax=Burkholderia pseudomallei (strain 1710b) TaxID=320372 RepID=Q3JWB4_BURP1|nr:hypothetical protein BURPS1710b_0726 [Burkholderia pseudomallei 1710b]
MQLRFAPPFSRARHPSLPRSFLERPDRSDVFPRRRIAVFLPRNAHEPNLAFPVRRAIGRRDAVAHGLARATARAPHGRRGRARDGRARAARVHAGRARRAARQRPRGARGRRQQSRGIGRRAVRRPRRGLGELRDGPPDPAESRPLAPHRRRLEALSAQHPPAAPNRPPRLHAAPSDGRSVRADAAARHGKARAGRAHRAAVRRRILAAPLQRRDPAPVRGRRRRGARGAALRRYRRRAALRRNAARRRAEQLARQCAARRRAAGGEPRAAEREAAARAARRARSARRRADAAGAAVRAGRGAARTRGHARPGRRARAGVGRRRAAPAARRHRGAGRLPARDRPARRVHRGGRSRGPLLRRADALLARAGRRRDGARDADRRRAALHAPRDARRSRAQLQAARHAAPADRPDERVQAQPAASAPVRRRGLAHRDSRPARADRRRRAPLPRPERDALPAAAARLGARRSFGRRLPDARRLRRAAALRGRALRRSDPRDRHARALARGRRIDGGALSPPARGGPRAGSERVSAARCAGHVEPADRAVLRPAQRSEPVHAGRAELRVEGDPRDRVDARGRASAAADLALRRRRGEEHPARRGLPAARRRRSRQGPRRSRRAGQAVGALARLYGAASARRDQIDRRIADALREAGQRDRERERNRHDGRVAGRHQARERAAGVQHAARDGVAVGHHLLGRVRQRARSEREGLPDRARAARLPVLRFPVHAQSARARLLLGLAGDGRVQGVLARAGEPAAERRGVRRSRRQPVRGDERGRGAEHRGHPGAGVGRGDAQRATARIHGVSAPSRARRARVAQGRLGTALRGRRALQARRHASRRHGRARARLGGLRDGAQAARTAEARTCGHRVSQADVYADGRMTGR